MYKLFLTLRYLRKRRIAYFAIAAVMLCTAMVLVVMSVMGGFLDQLKTKARGLLGDIIIDNTSYSGFPLYDAFIADISAWPEIVKATPVIYTEGLMRFPDTAQLNRVRVVGLRLEDVFTVNGFKQSLYYEKFYPGTTSLGPQQQPFVGFDIDAAPPTWVDWIDPDLGPIWNAPPPRLPARYTAALKQSWDAGERDTDTVPGLLELTTSKAGIQPVMVGQYDVVHPDPNDQTLASQLPREDGEPLPGIIIGRDLIAQRKSDGRYKRTQVHPRGRPVVLTLLPVSRTGTPLDPVKPAFRYADDSRTGIYEIDSQHVYCDFDVLQRYLRMDQAPRIDPNSGAEVGVDYARCSQIQIKIAPGVNAHALTRKLADHYHALAGDPRFKLDIHDLRLIDEVTALTWEESQAHMIAPIEKERQLVTILFAIISGVAALLVLCILYMIVLQKTRDIGVVKSIGGSHTGVALIFLGYGAAVGLVGSLLGAVVGCYVVLHINDIQQLLVDINPAWQVWNREVYSFDEIPNTVRAADVRIVVIAAVIASTLGALLAALRAGFMQPVEALRYE